jgi:hypothetical protein
VSAALQLTEAGVPLARGDTIQYIYTDAAHSNPLRRVMPVELIEGGREQYDKEKYHEMLLEAAETVLGFDRTLFARSHETPVTMCCQNGECINYRIALYIAVTPPCPKRELRIISPMSFIALKACLKLVPKFVWKT